MSTRQVWGEFTLDSEPTENSKNPVESGGVAETINKGINAWPSSASYGYTLLGTASVTGGDSCVIALDVYCCEKVQYPVKIEALISYISGVFGSYKCTANSSGTATRFKLAWKMASDSSASKPKFEIWLIDTVSTVSNRRRVAYNTHLINGITWAPGNNSTQTLPDGLTDFTLSYNSSN